jgi:hypothetical protein
MWYHERVVYLARFRHVAVAGKAGIIHSYGYVGDHDGGTCCSGSSDRRGGERIYVPSNGPLVPLWLYEKKPWDCPVVYIQRAASVVQMSASTFYHWVSESMVRLAFLLPLLHKERTNALGGNRPSNKPPLVLLVPEYYKVWRLAAESLSIMGLEWAVREYPQEEKAAAKAAQEAADAVAAGKLLVYPYDGSHVVAAAELTFANWAVTDARPGQEFLPPRLGLQIVRSIVHSSVFTAGLSEATIATDYHSGRRVLEMIAQANGGESGGIKQRTHASGEADVGTTSDELLVYISRTKTTAARRSIRNEAEVLGALEEAWSGSILHSKDFDLNNGAGGQRRVLVFDGTNVTLREQVDLFGRASVVFGTHGSALANIAFCSGGTSIVEVALPSPNLRMFMHTAAALSLSYWMLPATPANVGGSSVSFEGELDVSVDDVKQLIGKLRHDRALSAN